LRCSAIPPDAADIAATAAAALAGQIGPAADAVGAAASLGAPAAASAAVGGGRSEVTWQVVVGAIAGVIPFIVASIEFGKRIAAQQRCEQCQGSGLQLVGRYYRRCSACGGFLPWQSWRRFFLG
ncbi:hypothetical protein CLOP_g15983, partial [Closterium sp. NIES-67]